MIKTKGIVVEDINPIILGYAPEKCIWAEPHPNSLRIRGSKHPTSLNA